MHHRALIPLIALSCLLSSPLPGEASPVGVAARVVGGVHVELVRVDLADKATDLDIQLCNNAPVANSPVQSFGDEPFGAMVSRARAAAVINGTFFSKDAQKRVMGNMVRGGTFVKYSQWENAGTTFGLRRGNVPEMVTARAEGKPNWSSHWFSITCGPRLLKDGTSWLHPQEEGFTDSHVMGVAARSALGYTRDGRFLYLVSFRTPVSLAREADVMRALGCYQAMNLDGGASQGLAAGGKVLVCPGRNLTNAIAVYDSRHPAPKALKQAHAKFDGDRLAGFLHAVRSKFESLNYSPTNQKDD
jgi:hypothetical protein